MISSTNIDYYIAVFTMAVSQYKIPIYKPQPDVPSGLYFPIFLFYQNYCLMSMQMNEQKLCFISSTELIHWLFSEI